MGYSHTQDARILIYPGHQLDPKDILLFIEMSGFTKEWDDVLGLDVEEDLLALQVLIMAEPQCGAVIPGTGGLRKLEFSPPKWKKGKRKAARVCYVYFDNHGVVLLVTAYSKNRKQDITQQEKKVIKKHIKLVDQYLSERSYS